MSDTIYVVMEHGSYHFAGYATSEEEASKYCTEHNDYFFFVLNKINNTED